MRICIIDDNEMVLDALEMLLRDRGHDVFSAMNASVGIDLVGCVAPDLVVVDLDQPGTKGDAIVRQIRTLYPAMSVILTSGHAVPPSPAVGGAYGADLFLAKPFTAGVLIESFFKIQTLRGEAA